MTIVSYKQIITGLNIKPNIGFLGYSSVTLVNDGKENILFDVGGPGIRKYLINLKNKEKITKVFISHLHFDHCANIDLFSDIPVYLNKNEFNFNLKNNSSENNLVKIVVDSFLKKSSFNLFKNEFNLTKNIKVIITPGHTIANSSLMFCSNLKNVVIVGDAIETLTEYNNKNQNTKCFDMIKYQETKEYIKNNFDIVIPGHDFVIEKGKRSDYKPFLTYF